MFSRGLLLALALGACTPDICGRNSDCDSGKVCTTAGACIVPPADAGTASDGSAAVVSDAPTTPVRDADGDALQIEPADAAVDAAGDAGGNTIDAPSDDGFARKGRSG